jgi:glycosyltransferase involved in cell wall biosynthesis
MSQAPGVPYQSIPGVSINLPAVSVIIGNYNQGRFVGDAIRSVAKQSYVNFECVVVDDCSTDNSVEMIEAALVEIADPRFRFIPRQTNGGQMATMFTGVDAGNAPFVAFLDGDDIWLPSMLAAHIACHLNSQINAAISACNLAIIDTGGTLLAGTHPSLAHRGPARDLSRTVDLEIPVLAPQSLVPPARTIFVRSHYETWIWSPTSGMMFRRAVLDLIRPDNIGDFRICADGYLARFAHLVGGSIIAQDVHGYYRIHAANNHASHAVLGDNWKSNARGRADTTEVTRRTILEKLCYDPNFAAILPADHITETVTKLARTPDELKRALHSPAVKPRATLRWKFMRRSLRSFFRTRPTPAA